MSNEEIEVLFLCKKISLGKKNYSEEYQTQAPAEENASGKKF